MRRLSRRERLQEQVRALDAFPKVEPELQETTGSGGLVTCLTLGFIAVLVFSEFRYYRTVESKYDFRVDTDMRRDMNLTVDMTLAMKCSYLGADYVDIAGNSSNAAQWLKMDDAHFELAPNQLAWHRRFKAAREAESQRGLNSLARFLHSSQRDSMPSAAADACRIHGIMPISKVAGNFHITGGKSLLHARGHAHMPNSVPPEAFNFSHRIDRLSFSEQLHGVHALDDELALTEARQQIFQYFLKVVPSTTHRLGDREPFRSNHFSLTEQHRVVNPSKGSTGLPGIYIKYDLEAIGVHVYEERRSFGQFLIRMCGIVGGIFATSGMLHRLMSDGWQTHKGLRPGVLDSPQR